MAGTVTRTHPWLAGYDGTDPEPWIATCVAKKFDSYIGPTLLSYQPGMCWKMWKSPVGVEATWCDPSA
jgi:hypothetical protein